MRLVLRFVLIVVVSLPVAAVAHAQKFIAHVSPLTQAGLGGYPDGGGYGGGYGYDAGYGYRSERGHHGRGGYRHAPAFEPTMGYAHGEPDAVPSTYMEYEQALALGKRMLEEQSHAMIEVQPSLGEIARELRQASGSPSPSGRVVSATQDGNGQLVIYRESGGCR